MVREEMLHVAGTAPYPAPAYEFQSMLERLQRSIQQVKLADAELARDKAGRRGKGKLWARVVDFFCDTLAEETLSAAERHYQFVREDVRRSMTDWLLLRSEALLGSDTSARQQLSQLRRRQVELNNRVQIVEKLENAGAKALNDLDKAISACNSASNMEFFDLLSKNKGISLLSSLETSEASNAIRQARLSVEAFAKLAPKRGLASDLSVVDDTVDLVVDLAIDLPFDILSWFNMDALDTAENRCKQIRDSLKKSLKPVHDALHTTRHAHSLASQRIAELLQPYRKQAYQELPEMLRPLSPNP